MGPGMEQAERSNSSSVLMTGTAAFFILVLALEASRWLWRFRLAPPWRLEAAPPGGCGGHGVLMAA